MSTEESAQALGAVTARVQSRDGWSVRGAVLTVTDLTGRQAARAEGDDEGQLAAGRTRGAGSNSGGIQLFPR